MLSNYLSLDLYNPSPRYDLASVRKYIGEHPVMVLAVATVAPLALRCCV